MQNLIIGLGYKKKRGKDSAAVRLIDKYLFHRIAFADSLKAAIKNIFSFTEAQLNGEEKEHVDYFWSITPREVLQLFGTQLARNGYRDDIWIKSLERKVIKLREQYTNCNIVITDVRFKNEIDYIKNLGGYTVRIDRNIPGESLSTHPSEIELDSYNQWDFVINNNGSLSDLYAQIDSIMNTIKEKNQRKSYGTKFRNK